MSANDLYWSAVCIQSIKSGNENTFHYAIHKIYDSSRIQTLHNIRTLYNTGDEQTRKIINNYKHLMPVIIA